MELSSLKSLMIHEIGSIEWNLDFITNVLDKKNRKTSLGTIWISNEENKNFKSSLFNIMNFKLGKE